jgi:hypothetical protein
MQESRYDEISGEDVQVPPRVRETVFCPRNGRRVCVLFEYAGVSPTAPTGVALCPFDVYSNRFLTPLGGTPCDAACLKMTARR